jgi:hypothetical protein
MSIFDVVLNTDEVTVLSTPTNIDLLLDYGAQGERGSKVFAGSGSPIGNTSLANQDIFAYDLYIDISNASPTWSWLWQYVSKPTGYTWESLLKLNPSLYSTTYAATFNSSGIAQISIPLVNIVSTTTYTDKDKYIVQITPGQTTYPIALSIISKTIPSTSLLLSVQAVKYDIGAWSNLTGVQNLQISVTVI